MGAFETPQPAAVTVPATSITLLKSLGESVPNDPEQTEAHEPRPTRGVGIIRDAVLPGFVDSHSYLMIAGARAGEFAARMAGKPYAAGLAVALVTDCNPFASYTSSMPFCIALTVRGMHFTLAQAIQAATVRGAAALRRGDIGRIAFGGPDNVVRIAAPAASSLRVVLGWTSSLGYGVRGCDCDERRASRRSAVAAGLGAVGVRHISLAGRTGFRAGGRSAGVACPLDLHLDHECPHHSWGRSAAPGQVLDLGGVDPSRPTGPSDRSGRG